MDDPSATRGPAPAAYRPPARSRVRRRPEHAVVDRDADCGRDYRAGGVLLVLVASETDGRRDAGAGRRKGRAERRSRRRAVLLSVPETPARQRQRPSPAGGDFRPWRQGPAEQGASGGLLLPSVVGGPGGQAAGAAPGWRSCSPTWASSSPPRTRPARSSRSSRAIRNKRRKRSRQGSRLVALAVYGQWRSGTLAAGRDPALVGEACGRALELDAGDVEVAGVLARIYREQPQLLGKQQQKGVFTRVFRNAPQLFNERQQAEILAAIDHGQPQLLGREQEAVYDAQRQRAADGSWMRWWRPAGKPPRRCWPATITAAVTGCPAPRRIWPRRRRAIRTTCRPSSRRAIRRGATPNRRNRKVLRQIRSRPISIRPASTMSTPSPFRQRRSGVRQVGRIARQAGKARGRLENVAARPGERQQGQHRVELPPGGRAHRPTTVG